MRVGPSVPTPPGTLFLDSGIRAIATGLQSTPRGAGKEKTFPSDAEHGQEEDDALTAGVFDDARNLEVFTRYFASSRAAGGKAPTVREWRRRVKPFPSRAARKLQLAFLVETTSGMGENLSFLQKEFRSIVASVRKTHPNVAHEYALIVYRGRGADYLTRGIGLTSDLNAFATFLSAQSTAEGASHPVYLHEALRDANQRIGWDSSTRTARLIFWIGETPPRDGNVAAVLGQVDSLAGRGVRVYPVGAFGADRSAEAVFRASALVTGGQYVFLSDDSDAGQVLPEPDFPCYFIEGFKGLMIRLVSDVVAGRRTAPRPGSLVRTVGDPNQDGTCPYTRSFLEEFDRWAR